jgi:hypothetical protein
MGKGDREGGMKKTKRCGYCKREKPLTAFRASNLSPDGWYYNCEICREARKTTYRRRKMKHEHKADPKPGGSICCCGCYRRLDENFHPEPRETGDNGEVQIWNWRSDCWQQELEERATMFDYPENLLKLASVEGEYRGDDERERVGKAGARRRTA